MTMNNRQARALAALAANPQARFAAVGQYAEPFALVCVAIRDTQTMADVQLPCERFDAFALADLARQHEGCFSLVAA